MKKYSFILWAALTMTSVFTACTDNDIPMAEQTATKTATIRATIDGDLGSRVALEDDVESQKVKVDWAEGDDFKIKVNGTDYTFTYTADNKFECSDENFPAAFENAGTVTATYPATTPTAYANQPGTLDGAAALLAMTATLDVTAGQSTGNLNLNFTHKNSIVKMTLSNDAFKGKNVTGVALKSGSTAVATATEIFEGSADNGSIVAYFAVEPQAVTNISIVTVCEGSYYTETLANKTLETGKLYNVNKAMTKVTTNVAAYVRKGDFAMKDGSFIAYSEGITLTDEQKANVSGIVFWTTADMNTTEGAQTPATLTYDEIMKADFPNCTHGLIVSLKDVSQGTQWQSSYSDIASWQKSDFNADDKSDYKSIASGTAATAPINYILGYQNTKILKAYNEQCKEYNKVLPVSLLADFSKQNLAPANTTGWFIPSEKELTLLCGKDVDNIYTNNSGGTDTKTAMNTVLSSLGETYANTLANTGYWSSSEQNIDQAFYVYFNSGAVGLSLKYSAPLEGEYNEYYVRAVCAY